MSRGRFVAASEEGDPILGSYDEIKGVEDMTVCLHGPASFI